MERETPGIWEDARKRLEMISSSGLRRSLTWADNAAGTFIEIGGSTLLNFSSNNYLGLADHPQVKSAACRAIEQFGAGAGASRLVSGSMPPHRNLEQALARFKGTECALVFSSGYLANLGIIQTLTERADGSRIPVFFDRLSHASVIDATMASGARWRSFRHNDPAALEKLLDRAAGSSPRAVVVTDGVFSMDGDLAPLKELAAICERHGALMVADDAHGTGVLGPGGRGAAAHWGMQSPNLVQIGTLSKALGAMGGYVAGPAVVCDLLVNRARAFIYDTALAPACAGAATEALRQIEANPAVVETLATNIQRLRNRLRGGGMPVPDDPTPIIPVILKDAGKTVLAAKHLRDKGFLVGTIRPPTVPQGTSRLRITVTASHTPEHLDAVADSLLQIEM